MQLPRQTRWLQLMQVLQAMQLLQLMQVLQVLQLPQLSRWLQLYQLPLALLGSPVLRQTIPLLAAGRVLTRPAPRWCRSSRLPCQVRPLPYTQSRRKHECRLLLLLCAQGWAWLSRGLCQPPLVARRRSRRRPSAWRNFLMVK